MKRFVEGENRRQAVLLPEYLDDYVSEENPVRVIEVFVEELELGALGFAGVVPEATGRPAYHPSVLLKIYVYGYINQIASSRRLERESQRNVELMWLTGPGAGLQDHCRLQEGQRRGDPGDLPPVHRSVPATGPVQPRRGGDRRQQVQGSERSGQELHQGQAEEADGAGRGQHRALPGRAGDG